MINDIVRNRRIDMREGVHPVFRMAFAVDAELIQKFNSPNDIERRETIRKFCKELAKEMETFITSEDWDD